MLSSRTKLAFRSGLILFAAGFYACTDPATLCDESDTRACVGENGCSGEQSCNVALSQYEPCVCNPNSGSGGGDTTGETTTSGNGDGDGDGDGDPTTGGDGDGGSTSAEGGGDGHGGELQSTSTSGDNAGGAEDTGKDSAGGDGDSSDGSGGDDGMEMDFDPVIFDGLGIKVSPANNDYGISGSFYVRQDSYDDGMLKNDNLTHTEVTPVQFNKSHDQPCINGTIARVTGGQFGEIWGALIGLELADGTGAFDATDYDIEGFSFELSGSVGDAALRFEAKVEGSDDHFCFLLEHAPGETGAFVVSFDDLSHNCYGSAGSASFDPSRIESLEWIAMADAGSTSPVDHFCLERLEVF